MRYQVRLIDQNLPGLTRELALACWSPVDVLLPVRPGRKFYRLLYRTIRDVLRIHIQAFRYCGASRRCEQDLQATELGSLEWNEPFPPDPERIHRYLVLQEVPPSLLVSQILWSALRVVVREFPKRRWKGLARLLRRQIEKVLQGRVFRSARCGEEAICTENVAYDPWDARDAQNFVRRP